MMQSKLNRVYIKLQLIADTPINQNTNLQNSLTVSTHITDDGIMFDVYTKDFKKVTIPYIDYLNSKVCASEYVDYKNNEIKPNGQGMVEVKYRMKRKMVPADEIDLVDLHPDYRLSEVMRRVPLINYTDSVRLSMGTSICYRVLNIMCKLYINNKSAHKINFEKCWKYQN